MRIDVYEVLGFGLARISQFKIKKSSALEDFLFDFPYRNIVVIKVNCPFSCITKRLLQQPPLLN
jgi:hypothetical protein